MKHIALITGASSGIGKELARIHAAKGRDLILVARREKLLHALKDTLEADFDVTVKVVALDLLSEDAPQKLYDEVKESGLHVEYLINNAGFGGRGTFIERDWSLDKAMINLNITVLTELTRLFLPDMVLRGKGKILQVASTAAFVPGPDMAVYYASKAYVLSFSHALSGECEGTGVTVTALCPGATDTEFAKVADMTMTKGFKRTFSAKQVAKDAYSGMEKGKMTVVTGFPWYMKLALAFRTLLPSRFLVKTTKEFQKSI